MHAGLGRDDDLRSRLVAQRLPEPPLGEAEPVQRRAVEEPQPELVRALDDRERLLLRHCLVEPAQRRRAQAESRDGQAGRGKGNALTRIH